MGIDALITGESVAQVSSQTFKKFRLIGPSYNKLYKTTFK